VQSSLPSLMEASPPTPPIRTGPLNSDLDLLLLVSEKRKGFLLVKSIVTTPSIHLAGKWVTRGGARAKYYISPLGSVTVTTSLGAFRKGCVVHCAPVMDVRQEQLLFGRLRNLVSVPWEKKKHSGHLERVGGTRTIWFAIFQHGMPFSSLLWIREPLPQEGLGMMVGGQKNASQSKVLAGGVVQCKTIGQWMPAARLESSLKFNKGGEGGRQPRPT
jgi:hypothetical protein